MRKFFITFIVVSAMLVFSGSYSFPDLLQCGQKTFILGDSKEDIVAACGNPKSERIITEDESAGKILIELVFEVNGKPVMSIFDESDRLVSVFHSK